MPLNNDYKAKVFISYAMEDREAARRLYLDLQQAGVVPWMAGEDILPGQTWEFEIQRALKESSYVLVLLSSHSVSKVGYVQKELKKALEIVDELPPSQIFLIPARLDNAIPQDERLQRLHRVDLFPSYETGLNQILRVIIPEKIREEGLALIKNPYQIGNPLQITRKAIFRGRRDLRDIIVNALLEHNRPTLVLHGPRRMGKTSFLLQLPALLPNDTIPVFIDLQRPTMTQNNSAFLYNITRAIDQNARPYGITIPFPNRDSFNLFPFEVFEDWLENMALPTLNDFNLLITFDEFEKLGHAIQRGKLDFDILDELRHLIQHQTKMAFLFAGVKTMEDLGPAWPSYFINIKPLPISYLLPEEVRLLITDPDPESNFDLSYENEVIEEIITITHCHPYLVQLVCSAIVEEANVARVKQVDFALLDKAIVRALHQGEPFFRNVWDEMTGIEGQSILRQIAKANNPLKIHKADSEIQKSLTRMVKHKVISKNDNETYEVEVPLVKRWILELAPVT